MRTLSGAVFISVIMLAISNVGCTTSRAHATSGRSLVELDEAWAAKAGSKDVEAVMAFWTDSAVMYVPGVPPLYGKEAIREELLRRRSIPGYQVSWSPSCAGIDEGGSMAYTLGEGSVMLPDESGAVREQHGRYVAIWQRSGETWRCAVKCWSPGPSRDDRSP